jgi:hypothetical protein
MTFFEVTAEQKQLARIGQAMMDFSENYGKEFGLRAVTDAGLTTLNELSHVGNMLTMVGGVWGTKASDFTDADRKLIADFINKKVDIERK